MKLIATVLALLYPLVVFGCLTYNKLSVAAVTLGLIVGYRIFDLAMKKGWRQERAVVVACASTGVTIAAGFAIPSSPLYYPVAVNALLLVAFGASIISPPTMIERLASLRHGQLPPVAIGYCRKVCAAWTIFFLINMLIALDSVSRSLEWWSLYNGCISYVVVGVVFGVEYLIRRKVMRRAMLASILVALYHFAAPHTVYADAPLTLEQIHQFIKPPAPFRSSFSERRFISVLTDPLESRGEIECVPGRGLIWRVTSPVATTTLITPSGITTLNPGSDKTTIEDRANISAALLSLMSGELETALNNFSITPSGTRQFWTITLTPKDTLVSEVLSSIVVSGSTRPSTIEITHANKDRILTTFSDPKTLSVEETSKATATLHEAS